MYLVLSTIPHLYSILPLIKYYKYTYGYIHVILLSTLLSVLYHTYEESNEIITILDYSSAVIWVLYDIYMGYIYTNKKILFKIILGNSLVFFINIQIPYTVSYPFYHSLWHFINAYKCYYVSTLITMGNLKEV